MNRISYALIGALALGCGAAEDEHDHTALCNHDGPPIDAPEFAGFIDAAEKEEYCHANPGHEVCSNIGQLEQAWQSRRYHGQGTDGFPCYSTRGTASRCDFPKWKQFKVVQTSSGNCANHTSVSSANRTAAINGFRLGVLALNSAGTGVSVQPSTGQANHTTLNTDCDSSPTTGFTAQNRTGSVTTQIENLPGDETRAQQYSSSTLTVNPTALVNDLIACGISVTSINVQSYAQNLGIHEGLHAFGFQHFTSGVMSPDGVTCQVALQSVPQGFKDAMTTYNGSTASPIIYDSPNLEQFGP